MLRTQNNRLNPDGRAIVGVFNGDLALGVRAQVGHLHASLSDGGQFSKQPMGQLKRQRHEIVGLATSITKHHPLISCALLLGVGALHPLVDVLALVMDGTQHTTRSRIKLVLALRVADAGNGLTRNRLHVQVRGLGLDLSRQHNLTSRHQGFARHLGLWIKCQKMVDQRI